jgi:hypothetical protein
MYARHAVFSTAFAATLTAATASLAAPLTGTPADPNPFGWIPNSTNALNYAQQTPGRVGQVAPFVIFHDMKPGELTLSFSNGANGDAFFETRINGEQTGSTGHFVISGDTIHTGGTNVTSGTLNFLKTFFVAEGGIVEIRLALGGERDWDFDWVGWEVAAVPVPAALPLLLGALGLMGFAARRKSDPQA